MAEFGEAFAQQAGQLQVDTSSLTDQNAVYEAINELQSFYDSLDDYNKQVLDSLAQDYQVAQALTDNNIISSSNPLVAAVDGRGLSGAVSELWNGYQVAEQEASSGSEGGNAVA
jgi:hypothetical protein